MKFYSHILGVGNQTDKAELELLASKPEFAFEVNGYSALPKIQDILTYKTCEGNTIISKSLRINKLIN